MLTNYHREKDLEFESARANLLFDAALGYAPAVGANIASWVSVIPLISHLGGAPLGAGVVSGIPRSEHRAYGTPPRHDQGHRDCQPTGRGRYP